MPKSEHKKEHREKCGDHNVTNVRGREMGKIDDVTRSSCMRVEGGCVKKKVLIIRENKTLKIGWKTTTEKFARQIDDSCRKVQNPKVGRSAGNVVQKRVIRGFGVQECTMGCLVNQLDISMKNHPRRYKTEGNKKGFKEITTES